MRDSALPPPSVPPPPAQGGARQVSPDELNQFLAKERHALLAIARDAGALWPEDAVQDAALALVVEVTRGSVLDGSGSYSLKNYARRVVVNKAHDQRRRMKPAVGLDPDGLATEVTPEDQYEAEQKRQRQRKALRGLPQEDRKDVGGIAKHGSQAAYARAVGVPQQTMNSRFARLRERLSRALKAAEALILARLTHKHWAMAAVAAATIVTLLSILLPKTKESCLTTPDGPTLCLYVRKLRNNTQLYRTCHRSGFVLDYKSTLWGPYMAPTNYQTPNDVGYLPNSVVPHYGSAGDTCTPWSIIGTERPNENPGAYFAREVFVVVYYPALQRSFRTGSVFLDQ